MVAPLAALTAVVVVLEVSLIDSCRSPVQNVQLSALLDYGVA